MVEQIDQAMNPKEIYEAHWLHHIDKLYCGESSLNCSIDTAIARLENSVAADEWFLEKCTIGYPVPLLDIFSTTNYGNILQGQIFTRLKESFILSNIAMSSNIDWIVELGSGNGLNLAKIWRNGGPKDALYIGAEFTNAGRKCSEVLASVEDAYHFKSLPFDYTAPDFTSVIPQTGRGVVFTCFSIEQIPILKGDFIQKLAGIQSIVKCFHIEPITWQLSGILERSEVINAASASTEVLRYVEKVMYKRSHVSRYNLNFGELVREGIETGIIEIDHDCSYKYFSAHRHDLFCSSLVWRAKRSLTDNSPFNVARL